MPAIGLEVCTISTYHLYLLLVSIVQFGPVSYFSVIAKDELVQSRRNNRERASMPVNLVLYSNNAYWLSVVFKNVISILQAQLSTVPQLLRSTHHTHAHTQSTLNSPPFSCALGALFSSDMNTVYIKI